MILDELARADDYRHLHRGFARAFDVLRRPDLLALAPGRHDIDGDRMYLSLDDVEGRGRAGARLEHHRAHLDIQVTLAGDEQIGWMPLTSCTAADGPFDAARDIGFFSDRPETWLCVRPGMFAVFFPCDAHAPLAGPGRVKKAILKIRL